MPRNLQSLRVKEEENEKVSEKLFPRVKIFEEIALNQGLQSLRGTRWTRTWTISLRDGLDFAHGPHHGLDSANSPLAGPPRPEVAGRGTTVRGQTLINRLQEDRDAQLRHQRMPKRKGSEPTEDGSTDPLRGV